MPAPDAVSVTTEEANQSHSEALPTLPLQPVCAEETENQSPRSSIDLYGSRPLRGRQD